MLAELQNALAHLPELLDLDRANEWNSLFIDYEKPYVKRLWRDWGEYRLSLHQLAPCAPGEALYHPHPWPSATAVVSGGYDMDIGFGPDLDPPPIACTVKMRARSMYEMLHPNSWHAVRPNITTFSVMLTGKPWNRTCIPNSKELRPLTSEEREEILASFKWHVKVPSQMGL